MNCKMLAENSRTRTFFSRVLSVCVTVLAKTFSRNVCSRLQRGLLATLTGPAVNQKCRTTSRNFYFPYFIFICDCPGFLVRFYFVFIIQCKVLITYLIYVNNCVVSPRYPEYFYFFVNLNFNYKNNRSNSSQNEKAWHAATVLMREFTLPIITSLNPSIIYYAATVGIGSRGVFALS